MGLLGKLESFGKALWATGKAAVGGGGADKSLRAADSPILDGGQFVIAGMKLTTGVGTPDDGERFGQAGARSRDAVGTLRSAQPNASWSGEGAESYSNRNVEQIARIENMTAVDHEVHRVLAEEAFQVDMHRDRLDSWYNWLADVGLVTFALGRIPGVGRSLKAAADAHAVLVAVGSSSIELYQLSSEVDANAAALQQLVGRYGDVAGTAAIAKTAPDRNPPAPSEPEQAPEDTPAEEHPEETPVPVSDEKPRPVGHLAAPASRPSGADGGLPMSGGAPAAPETAMPEAPVADVETSGSGPAPASAGAMPAAAPPPPMSAGAVPMAAAPAIPVGLIKEAIQAALQKEAEKRDAEERDKDGKRDEDGEAKDGEAKDEDGDGVPDEDTRPDGEPEEVASGTSGTDADRPPVHVEMDVDVARLGTPVTVTFTGENPIGPPPTPTP
jgi:hypothetical protein